VCKHTIALWHCYNPAVPTSSKDRVFRDPVHGLIEFKGEDRPLADLLDTHAVQRLRRIKQMGFAWLVYSGAEHSRFGHALGAFCVAQRVTKQLRLDEQLARHVRVAALLHDIGHGPFSHAWEHVFPGCDHESWGARIVAEDEELHAALERVEPGLADTLQRFWRKDYEPAYARKLVSSQLDVDRLDYLLRDGHYSGAGYATYDLDWIIFALQIGTVRNPASDGPPAQDLVVDYRRGMFAVEQYLFARSYMYAQVYHHKAVRAAEWLFIKTMERFAELARNGAEPSGLVTGGRLARSETVAIGDYLALHDVSVQTALDQWAGYGNPAANDPVLADLARRVVDRRLFKTFDLGDDARVAEKLGPAALDIATKHFGKHGHYYMHIDTAKHAGYVAKPDEELHVIDHPRYGAVTLSRLLEDMPLGQPSATVRLLCAPELVGAMTPLVEDARSKMRGRR